jgi:hypothetical protein
MKMKVYEQPQTEQEYWETIEVLGNSIRHLDREISHGIVEDPKGRHLKFINKTKARLEQLVEELTEKFNILLPQDSPHPIPGQPVPIAPKGKRNYWEWYDKMKAKKFKLVEVV